MQSRFAAVLIPLLVLGLPACARAHVIPNDARIQTFLKPDGQRLQVLVRVPLEAMVDLTYPTRGGNQDLLDLDRADRVLRELSALWIANNIDVYEGPRQLPYPRIVEVRASLAFDGSFASFDQALRHVTGPRLTNSVDFVWNQGLLDVLLEYPITSDRSRFAIHSKLSTLALRTTTTLRFLPPGGDVRALEYTGDPGRITLDPQWYQAVALFLRAGFREILGGADYWLLMLTLVMPLRRLRDLVPVAVAFAVAEAVTLNPSSSFAPDTLWFQPLVGVVIAGSIVYMAIEDGMGTGLNRRWMLAFGFGLVLGFRFSLPLRDSLQFAGTHTLASLASFGAGVDLGQIFLVIVLAATMLLFFRLVKNERAATLVLSFMAGDIAWHRLGARADVLRQYQFQVPALTPGLALAVVSWMTDLVIAAAVFWLLLTAIRRFTPGPHVPDALSPK